MPAWNPADLVPGLYLALLGALLLWTLARWFDRVPWRVVAVFALVLLALFGPVLFGGKVLLPLDNLRGHVPFQSLPPTQPHGNLLQGDLILLVTPSLHAVREMWFAGQWPLWNPRVGAGMPLLGDPQAQAFQPLVLAGMALPLDRAAGVVAALRVLVALLFSFLLFRRLELSDGSATAGALAFGLSGFVLLWVGWPLSNTAVLLPLVLYALVRLDQEGGRRDAALTAVAVATFLVSGHPEAIVWGGLFALAFAAGRLAARPRGARRLYLWRAVGAAALGVAFAAPALLTAADAIPRSLRATRMEEGSLQGASLAPDLGRRLLPVAAANAYGNSRFNEYWGLTNTNEDGGGFVGTAALLAALAGALAFGARKRFPQERLALATVGLSLLLLAGAGRFLPMGDSRRPLLLVAFGLAYLAACTLERARRGEISRLAIGLAALGLGAVLAWGYLAHPHPQDPARLEVLRLGWLHWQGRFLALSAVLLFAGLGKRWLPWAIAPLVAAELCLALAPANPPMPRALTFPVNGPMRFLQEHAGEGRMAALGRDLPPNLASLYGLADARLYNPMTPREYVAFTAPVLQEWWGEVPLWGRPRHPLYQRLGVRYLLTGPERELPPPLRRVFADADGAVWEVPGAKRLLILPAGAPGSPGTVRRVAAPAGRISARVDLPQATPLETSLYQDGSWRVLAGGRKLRAEEAPPFLKATLPAGRYRLEMLYRPASFVAGLALLAAGLAFALSWWIPPPAFPHWPRQPRRPRQSE